MRDLLNWEILKSDNYVVLDFETDNSAGQYGSAAQPGNRLILACWKVGKQGRVKSCWGGEYDQQELLDDLAKADFWVAHNAKYEAGWLLRMGVGVEDQTWFCSRLAEYVLLGNRAAGGEGMAPVLISLDACTQRRGGRPKHHAVQLWMDHGVNPVSIPRTWLQKRCMRDVEDTECLFLKQRKELASTNRLPVLWTRSLISPNLADIERRGMWVDRTRVEKAHKEYTEKLVSLTAKMDTLTGGINTASSIQVASFVYDSLGFKEQKKADGTPKRTLGGARLTGQKVLDALRATNAKQREFVALRKDLSKVSHSLSKALDFLWGVSRERAGVFLGEFNQANTATHRLSSSGVKLKFEMFGDKEKTTQFQNLPRVFKPLFVAGGDI